MGADVNSCAHDRNVNCGNCRLNSICMPLALSGDEVVKLDEVVTRGRPIRKGSHLFEQDSDFRSIFAVRSGALKTYRVTESGEEHVMGFYLPGEIVGIDGVSRHRYATSAIALDTSAVCEIPFERIEQLSLQLPSLQRYMFQLMSREITDDQKMLSIVSRSTAEERVASVLLSLSARQARRQLSATEFLLPMSRQDLANFLGLTVETISRVLRRFKDDQILAVEGKSISILDAEGLRSAASV